MYCAVFVRCTTAQTRCRLLPFVVTLCHSFSLFVTRCHSLSLVASLVVTRCHLSSLVVPLVITRCHSCSLVVPLVVTRCHSLSLVVTRCTTRLSFYKRSETNWLISKGTCVLLFYVVNGFSIVKKKYVKECQTFTIEKNWRFQNLSEKWIYRKENLTKCTNSEGQKSTRYIRGNVYFDIIVFSRFFLVYKTLSQISFNLFCSGDKSIFIRVP